MTMKPPGPPPAKPGAAPMKAATPAAKPVAPPSAKPGVPAANPIPPVAKPAAVAKPGTPVATVASVKAAATAMVATGGAIATRTILLPEAELARHRDTSQDPKTADGLIARRLADLALGKAIQAARLANGSREALQFVARGKDVQLTLQALNIAPRLDAKVDAVIEALMTLPAPLSTADNTKLTAAVAELEAVSREGFALGKKYLSVRR